MHGDADAESESDEDCDSEGDAVVDRVDDGERVAAFVRDVVSDADVLREVDTDEEGEGVADGD